MSNRITGKEYALKDIFSQQFDYHIPPYQRPYAWTEEECETLFDDLYDFFLTEKTDNYFLGSIVLKKVEDKPLADVIDGQQRLTTLTILLAAIASCLTGKMRNACEDYLREPGNPLTGLKPEPRLHLREKESSFFESYIQNVNLDSLIALDPEALETEAKKHIRANCEVFLKRINAKFNNDETQVQPFCTFLLTRCFLVSVSAPSQQSAFRVFSVMNNRGLDLLPIDIIKADVIGEIPADDQQSYTEKWEDLEVQTSRDGFNEVFTHTRMIFAKAKSKKNLLDEFREYVLTKLSPQELIDDYLTPYAEAYIILKNKKYVAVKNAESVNGFLLWLNKIDNSDWMPSAIRFFAEHSNDPDYILWFVRKLERLASYLHITAKDVNRRIERYALLLDEMNKNPDSSLDDPITSIELTNSEKEEFVKVLCGDVYRMTGKRRNYVILRLNEFVSDGTPINYSPALLTIEHVLPQTVDPKSEWAMIWSDPAKRELWVHKLANLVPLTRPKNSEAQNFDFDKKKDVYFTGKKGTTAYPLTTQVVHETTWDEQTVIKRQQALIQVFTDAWDLKYISQGTVDHTDNGDVIYHIMLRGSNASGYANNDHFIIFKGSKIAADTVPSFAQYYPNAFDLRNKLISDGIIVNDIFTADYDFDSLSLAASVIVGRTANGYREWKDGIGLSYSENLKK